MAKSQETIILHVDMKYEADCAVDTLKQHSIPAYYAQTADKNVLGLPGAIGINETGYDIYILASDKEAAERILEGIGYEVPDSSEEASVCAADTPSWEGKPECELTDEEKRQRLQQSLDELSPGKRIWYSICIGAFVLVGLAIFVVLCDLLVGFVKSLF